MDSSILTPPGMPLADGEIADFDHSRLTEHKVPRYVYACECEMWTLETWPKDDKSQAKKFIFRCKSWRHSGQCRLWKGAQDFVRIKEAILSRGDWTVVTLTHRQGELQDPADMYRDGCRKWSALRQRIIQRFGKIKYIQTWERHESGFPHVNVAISNANLAGQCLGTPVDNWLSIMQAMAVGTGFGPIGWLDPLRDKLKTAGYLAKCARELTGVKAEYQIPENAPKGFRRIRASVRLLPPPIHNPDIAGTLHFARLLPYPY